MTSTEASYSFQKVAKIPEPGCHQAYTTDCILAKNFNKNCQPVTLEWLIQQEDELDNESIFDTTMFANIDDITSTKFLYVMLIDLTRGKSDMKLEVSGFRKNKRMKMQTTYRHKYTFACLNDPQLHTCVLLEKNNDEHHNHWLSNLGKLNVKVGIRLAIQNPRLVGRLPTKSVIIETRQPFIILTGPPIPTTPLLSDNTQHTMKYFALKGKTIVFVKTHLPVPWRTTCNAEFCDRLHFTDKTAVTCGCWGNNSKNDSTAKNVVIQFDFRFQENNKIIRIRNFTSLTTSLLFMKNKRMVADFAVLSINENTRTLQHKVLQAMKHVNDNGGWTIVGWFIRGEKQTDDVKDDNEENLLSDGDVKHNVCYLYPTTEAGMKLSDTCVFGPDDLTLPSTSKDNASGESTSN